MKNNKIAILMIIITVAVMIAPASAYFSSQNVETKAERMVTIAENALEAVMDLAQTVESNTTIMGLLVVAELDTNFYGNVSLCVENGTIVNGVEVTQNGTGWEALNASKEALLAALETEDYEVAIEEAQEALGIFRDVLKAINGMLIDVGVETCQTCDAEAIQEAIERSQDRITSLTEIIADEEMLTILDEAQGNLTAALNALPDVDLAKDYLQTANELISEVCQNLKTIAQDLNPGRIRSYIAKAYKNNERVQERFRNTWKNQDDINEFLQGLGYENEEEFLEHFDAMIEKAQNAKTVKEAAKTLQDLGKMMQNTDDCLNQRGNNGNNANKQGSSKGNGNSNMGGTNSP